ncbi:MAG: peptidase inhibitor family I36 protein [Deltaproteobacteria bacterium]|nr:peptidase inhibitor family I36 protein [Deltaproteobacteria bacterium]
MNGGRLGGRTAIIVVAALGLLLLGASLAGGYENYKSSKDYCGPKLEAYNHTLPNPVPSRPIPGVNFNSACYQHDKCYSMCASNCSSKSMCDREFKARMEAICQTKNLVIRPTCMDLARTYYLAIDKAGGISYHCGTPACPDSTETLPMGTPGAGKAFFFEQERFAGASAEWSNGANVNDLTKRNTPTGAKWNDRISSIKVGSGVRVLIFEHINYGGRCMTLSAGREYPQLTAQNANLSGRENWNDRISSLKVVPPDQVCP